MRMCGYCKEPSAKEFCEVCSLLPRCEGCGMFGFELCDTCFDYQDSMSNICWSCAMEIDNTKAEFLKRGNMCNKCSVKLNREFELNFS